MRLADFEAMVRRLWADVPPEFLDGVVELVVSPKTVPHPVRGDVYTLGECIPLPGDSSDSEVQSRIVLYYGSFQALARLADFSWRQEAWETLTHELRHHLEWRARRDELEAFDAAAEQNFARHAGERFDPLFFLEGESPVPGVFRIDDDFFLERAVRTIPSELRFDWHGRHYEVSVPSSVRVPCYLTVDGVVEPPPGDLVLVLRRRPSVFDLFRGVPEAMQARAPARVLR